eukprot:4367338-Prymnesium_polylepis.1
MAATPPSLPSSPPPAKPPRLPPRAPPPPTAPPSAPPAAPIDPWVRYEGINCASDDHSFASSDLQGSLVASPTACERECLGRPRCEGFTHHSRSNECVFKRDLIVTQCVHDHNFTLFKRPGPVPLSLEWQAFAGISCWGQGEGAVHLDAPGSPVAGVGTIDDCLHRCES